MIIVKTRNHDSEDDNIKKNIYTCPHCDHKIAFGYYIGTTCEACNKHVFNVEKLLYKNIDTHKVNYYTNGKV